MLGNKAKPRRSNSKGNLNGGNSSNINTSNSNTLLSLSTRSLHLDTVASGFGRALSKSIPVLSIFALVGIVSYALSITNFNLLVTSTGKAYAVENSSDSTSASLIIDNGNILDRISATTGEVAYASHNVKVNASDIDSYTITITGPTSLNGNSSITGANNKTPANMANNTWGYAWGAENATEANMAYQSFTGTAQTLENSIAANNTVALSKKLAFAAKFGDNAAEGHYTATVGLSLTVTPKKVAELPIDTMQEMTSEICDGLETGIEGTLVDVRDENNYTIKKMQDGNCWMTQNLRIIDKTISSVDSDVVNSFTISGLSTPNFNSDTTAKAYYNGDGNYGAYYSWCAATAGCKTSSNTNPSAGVDAASSICPKGWKLPRGGTVAAHGQTGNNFAGVFGYFDIGLADSPNIFTDVNASFVEGGLVHGNTKWLAAGYYSNSSSHSVGDEGYYWSRTANSGAGAYALGFGDSNLNPASYNYRRVGYSVRCVAEVVKYTYTITYELKSGHTISVGSLPQPQVVTSPSSTYSFMVPNTNLYIPCKLTNYLGDDSKVYTIGDTVTLTSDNPNITLTTNDYSGAYCI